MVDTIYSSHILVGCLCLAREVVSLPGMNAAIKECVSSSGDTFNTYRKEQQKSLIYHNLYQIKGIKSSRRPVNACKDRLCHNAGRLFSLLRIQSPESDDV